MRTWTTKISGMLLALVLTGSAALFPAPACAQTATVEVDPASSRGPLPRLFRPSVMMAFADSAAVNAFLALPGPLGTVRLTLEPLITESKNLAEYLQRLEREAAGMRALAARDAEIVLIFARMPTWLARTGDESLAGRFGFTRREASPPKDYEAYANFVYETVRVINTKLGLSPWYEFWNEPDSIAFWGGTQDELLRTYQSFAQGARRADTRARVGGLAVSGWYQKRPDAREPLLAAFLQRVGEANGLPLDFVSWHNLTKDPEHDWWGAEEVRGWLTKNGISPALPQIITEWNRWSTFPQWFDKEREGALGAAYIPATLHAMERAGITMQTFAALQDFNPAPRDQSFIGDFGLVTKEPMLKKASFHVMNMLAQMGPQRIGVTLPAAPYDTEGVQVLATMNGRRMAILISRFANDPSGNVIRSLQRDGFHVASRLGLTGAQFDAFLQRKTDLARETVAPEARQALVRAREQFEKAQRPAGDLDLRVTVRGNAGPFRYEYFLVDTDHANPAGRYRTSRAQGRTHAQALEAARAESLSALASGTGALPNLRLQTHAIALLLIDLLPP